MFGPSTGANLEHLVLSKSKPFFKNYSNFPTTHSYHSNNNANDKWRAAANKVRAVTSQYRDDENTENEQDSCCNSKFCWWSPPRSLIPTQFCLETSIHGFVFMGQAKRHLTERLFWLISFLLSLGAATYLIWSVWDRYNQLPVIVSFQAQEQDIDSIPFPAVTLCNMNKFPRWKVQELENIILKNAPDDPKHQEAKLQLTFVRSVCNAQQSFAKDVHFAYTRGRSKLQSNSNNDTITADRQDDMMDFLLNNTIPCDELIRLCVLGEEEKNCSDLFKPVITDYGKCCVFNIMPLPLLLENPKNKNMKNASIYDNPVLGSYGEKFWPMKELNEWRKWNYDDGLVLGKNSTRPWKQKRAGLPYGLSVLVDPNTEEYYCPVADSKGMRYILHSPLEMPHVMEFASVADLNKEILIEVHPDMTNADDEIRDIEHAKRKCYFGMERDLNFFGPYTGGNCIDECTALVLTENCSCTFFYMPRDIGVKICNNDPLSDDFICIEKARIDLQATLKHKCGHCDGLCEDIAYNYETTIATLQDKKHLWMDHDPKVHRNGVPSWVNHKMSVVHIFFGSETTVPKYRKRLYGTTDLIANTGGILGLCLGFSVLSGVEVLYFITLRSFWKYCRRRQAVQQIARRFLQMFTKPNNKVIMVNPNTIPIYPSGYYPNGFGYLGRQQQPQHFYGGAIYGGGNVRLY